MQKRVGGQYRALMDGLDLNNTNDDNDAVADADTIVLESDVLPPTLPMARAKGVHVSDVIHSLAVSLGHYVPSVDGFNTAQLELGSAYEYGLIHRLRETHPDRYVQPGEMTLDGLHGNMDQFDSVDWLVDEYKHTKITVRHDPVADVCPVCAKTCVKFWKWWVQCGAYCTMATALFGVPVRECRLRVLFCRGDYKGRSDEQYRQWRRRFSEAALQQNWNMLVTNSAALRCSECNGDGCAACNGSGVKLTEVAT